MAGIHDMLFDLRQMFSRDHQDVRTILRERTRRDRAGEYPRQVKGADAGKRAVALGKRFRVAVRDLDDLDDRLAGQHLAMRGREPLVVAAHHRAARAGLIDRCLQIERIPAGHCLADRVGMKFTTKHFLDACLQVRQSEMRQKPAPVLGRPRLRAGDHVLVARIDDRLESAAVVGRLQVVRAA